MDLARSTYSPLPTLCRAQIASLLCGLRFHLDPLVCLNNLKEVPVQLERQQSRESETEISYPLFVSKKTEKLFVCINKFRGRGRNSILHHLGGLLRFLSLLLPFTPSLHLFFYHFILRSLFLLSLPVFLHALNSSFFAHFCFFFSSSFSVVLWFSHEEVMVSLRGGRQGVLSQCHGIFGLIYSHVGESLVPGNLSVPHGMTRLLKNIPKPG